MDSNERFINLVTQVTTETRASAESATVKLTTIRDLCVAVAYDVDPDLVEFLNTNRGLVSVSVILSHLDHLLIANDTRGTSFTFVRDLQ